MFRHALLVAGLAAALSVWAADVHLTREGPYWVETRPEPLRLNEVSLLRIRMRGPVTVRGSSSEPSALLTIRVRARSEAEARRLFRQLNLRVSSARSGRGVVQSIALIHPPRPI